MKKNILFLVLITLFSCSKDEHNMVDSIADNIIGKWEYVWVFSEGQSGSLILEFKSDKTMNDSMVITEDSTGNVLEESFSNGIYQVNQEEKKVYITYINGELVGHDEIIEIENLTANKLSYVNGMEFLRINKTTTN